MRVRASKRRRRRISTSWNGGVRCGPVATSNFRMRPGRWSRILPARAPTSPARRRRGEASVPRLDPAVASRSNRRPRPQPPRCT